MTLLAPLALMIGIALTGGVLRRGHRSRSARLVVGLGPVLAVLVAALIAVPLFAVLADVRVISVWSRLIFSSAAMLALLPALFWGGARIWVAGCALSGLGLLLFADLVHWRFFQTLLSPTTAGAGGQLWDVRESIWAEIHGRDLALLPLAAAGPLLIWLWPRPQASPARWRAPLAALGCAALLALATLPAAGNVSRWMGQRFSWKVFSQEDSLASVGVLLTHVREVARTLRELGLEQRVGASEMAEIRATLAAGRVDSDDPAFGAARDANLLLVQVESLQGWVVGARALGAEITPFINALRAQGRYYPNIWDLTAGSPTADCEYMVLNAHHPLPRGAVAFRRAHNDFVTIAEIAKAAGYSTLFAHAYKRGMWNRAILYPRYGFDRVLFRRELGDAPKLGWGLADHAMLPSLVPRLMALPSPWLAMAVTLTSHHPFLHMPPERQSLDVGGLDGTPLGGYIHAMRYVDDSLRQLFAELDRSGVSRNTAIAIYGDHDSKLTFDSEVLGQAAQVLELPPQTIEALGRRDWLTKKVPLIIVMPAPTGAEQIETIGGQIDIGPTLLHLLGLHGSAAFQGRPLLGQAGQAVRYDGSAVDPQWIFRAPEQENACLTRAGEPAPLRSCDALRRAAERELRISWMVTSQNLAHQLHNEEIRPRR